MNAKVQIEQGVELCKNSECEIVVTEPASFCFGCLDTMQEYEATAAVPAVSTKDETPGGVSQHTPGAKLDANKMRPSLVINGFPNALIEIIKLATFGANKYTDDGWREVPDGINRYTDAMYRHLLLEHSGEDIDPDSQMLHATQTAWNSLARLELILADRAAH